MTKIITVKLKIIVHTTFILQVTIVILCFTQHLLFFCFDETYSLVPSPFFSASEFVFQLDLMLPTSYAGLMNLFVSY